jgi:hypothetical protein
MPVGPTLVVLKSEPKLDLTFAMCAMSACEKSCPADCPVAQAASRPAHATATIALGFDIAANVPADPRSAAQSRHRFHQQFRREILSE